MKKGKILLRRFVFLVFCVLGISYVSSNRNLVQKSEETLPNFGNSTCTPAHSEYLYFPYFDKTFEQFGTFLNHEKDSPRSDLYSILQFLSTLLIYASCVFLRNVQHSRFPFNADFLADQLKQGAMRNAKDCWKLQKERLYPFYRRFRGNFFATSKTPSPVYYFYENENHRMVSFIDIKESSPVSILTLARCGFYYNLKNQLVECIGCGQQMYLKEFNDAPSSRKFHASTSCPYVMSISPSPSQEALGSQLRDEKNHFKAETFRAPHTLEDQANQEPSQTEYATGGQLLETDCTSSDSASPPVYRELTARSHPEIPLLDVPSEMAGFCSDNVARAPQSLENEKVPKEPPQALINEKVPKEPPQSLINGKEECDSLPTPSRESGTGLQSFYPNSSAAASSGLSQLTAATPSCVTHDGKCHSNGARPKTESTQGKGETSPGVDAQSKSDRISDWADKDKFAPECCFPPKSVTKQHGELKWTKACSKNDIHDSFYPVDKLKTSQLPDFGQNVEFLRFVITCANLTVKLQVRSRSSDRPGDDMCPGNAADDAVACGSGLAYMNARDDMAEALIKKIKESSPKSKMKKAKQFLRPNVAKTSKCYFSVQTTRHLVFDNSEAQHTDVLLEIQDAKSRNVKKFRGKGVFAIHDKEEGNYRTTLLCESSDLGLLQALQRERENFTALEQGLSQEVMGELLEKCFVIAHPHGLNKTVTFGLSTIVKYALYQRGKDEYGRQFDRYSNRRQEIPNQNIRETLMYTAGTCNGSSGAPVFFCRKMRRCAGEQIETQLVVWIHNGVEKESSLGCTVMNSYQPQLTEGIDSTPAKKEKVSTPTPSTGSDSASKNTSTRGPWNVKFVTMESRLQSFKQNYKSATKHSPLELAEAGFYNTGKGDLVKCFSCGLGLKSWKPTNDVYEEHKSNMPDCNFLKLHSDTTRKMESALLYDENDKKNDEPLRIRLLKSERKKLASKFTCKVCWKYSASELFLACGDLFACERCATFLYACPICHKEIYATVTTFLS